MTRRNTLGKAIEEESEWGDFLKDVEGGLIPDAQSESDIEDIGEVPAPRVPKRGKGRCAVIVCNHIGWPEIFNLVVSPIFPGFTPKKEIVEIPLASAIVRGL